MKTSFDLLVDVVHSRLSFGAECALRELNSKGQQERLWKHIRATQPEEKPSVWIDLPFEEFCSFYYDLAFRLPDAIFGALEAAGYDEYFETEEDEPLQLPSKSSQPSPYPSHTYSTAAPNQTAENASGDNDEYDDDTFNPSDETYGNASTLDTSVCEPMDHQSMSMEDGNYEGNALEDSTTIEARQLLTQLSTPPRDRPNAAPMAAATMSASSSLQSLNVASGTNVTPQHLSRMPLHPSVHDSYSYSSASSFTDSSRPPKTSHGRRGDEPSIGTAQMNTSMDGDEVEENILEESQTEELAQPTPTLDQQSMKAQQRRARQYDDEVELSSSASGFEESQASVQSHDDYETSPSSSLARPPLNAVSSSSLISTRSKTSKSDLESAYDPLNMPAIHAPPPFPGGKPLLSGKTKLSSLAPTSLPSSSSLNPSFSLSTSLPLHGTTSFDLRPKSRHRVDTDLGVHSHREDALPRSPESTSRPVTHRAHFEEDKDPYVSDADGNDVPPQTHREEPHSPNILTLTTPPRSAMSSPITDVDVSVNDRSIIQADEESSPPKFVGGQQLVTENQSQSAATPSSNAGRSRGMTQAAASQLLQSNPGIRHSRRKKSADMDSLFEQSNELLRTDTHNFEPSPSNEPKPNEDGQHRSHTTPTAQTTLSLNTSTPLSPSSSATSPSHSHGPPSPVVAKPLPPGQLCEICDDLRPTLWCHQCKLFLCQAGNCDNEVHNTAKLQSHTRLPIPHISNTPPPTDGNPIDTDTSSTVTSTSPIHDRSHPPSTVDSSQSRLSSTLSPHPLSSYSTNQLIEPVETHRSQVSEETNKGQPPSDDPSQPNTPKPSIEDSLNSSESSSLSPHPALTDSVDANSIFRPFHIRPRRFALKFHPPSINLFYDLIDSREVCIDHRLHRMPVEIATNRSVGAEIDRIVRRLYRHHWQYLGKQDQQPIVSVAQVIALIKKLLQHAAESKANLEEQ